MFKGGKVTENFWYHVCLEGLNPQTYKLMEKAGPQEQTWFVYILSALERSKQPYQFDLF